MPIRHTVQKEQPNDIGSRVILIRAIKKIKSYPKSKLLIEISPPVDEEIIVGQENVNAFKEWAGN
ncbi:MAG: hypothetical protein ABJB86_18805 [Bacteroidota bacterium]